MLPRSLRFKLKRCFRGHMFAEELGAFVLARGANPDRGLREDTCTALFAVGGLLCAPGSLVSGLKRREQFAL